MGALVRKVFREPVQLMILAPYRPKQEWFHALAKVTDNSFLPYRAETNYLPRLGGPDPPAPAWDTTFFSIHAKGVFIKEFDTIETKEQMGVGRESHAHAQAREPRT